MLIISYFPACDNAAGHIKWQLCHPIYQWDESRDEQCFQELRSNDIPADDLTCKCQVRQSSQIWTDNVICCSYSGYISVGQPQDSLPIRSIDEKAIWLGDRGYIGPQGGVGPMWDRHQVGSQLPLPATLGVWDVHTPTLVTVRAGAVNEQRRGGERRGFGFRRCFTVVVNNWKTSTTIWILVRDGHSGNKQSANESHELILLKHGRF